MYPAEKVSPQILSLITALETGLIGLAGIICYLIFLPFYSFSYQLPWEIILLVNAIIIGLLVIWPNAIVWIINFLFRIFRRATITVKISRKNLLLWLAIYITTWVLDGTALFFIGKVLVDTSIPFGDVMGVSTISAYAAYLSQFLPTSLAIKEVAMSTLFKFWLPLGVGLVISIALRMAMTLIEIINAVVAKKIASTPEKAG